MKLLMATSADENITNYTKYTHPILKMFAKKWKANFKVISTQHVFPESCRVLELYDIFEDYDRIFFIDSDTIINKNCPNIFDIVPYDTIGLVFEDKGSRLKNRRTQIEQIKKGFGGAEHWVTGYFNMGVFLISKVYRDVFTKVRGQLWPDKGWFAQIHWNYQMMKFGYKYIDLGYMWNHMSMFSEPWNGSPLRFDSYIIHYAGGGRFPDKGNRSKAQLIIDDIKKIYEERKCP